MAGGCTPRTTHATAALDVDAAGMPHRAAEWAGVTATKAAARKAAAATTPIIAVVISL